MASDRLTESFSGSRRNFIKMAAAGSAFASALSAVTTAAAQEAAARLPENESGPYDLVIAGGRCVDPETGLDAVRNVGMKGGRIAAISDRKLEGTKTLNAEGQIVAPGFIDLHAHGQQQRDFRTV